MHWESTACLQTFDAALSAVHETTSHTVLYFLRIKKNVAVWVILLQCFVKRLYFETVEQMHDKAESTPAEGWIVSNTCFSLRETHLISLFAVSESGGLLGWTEDCQKFCATTWMFHQFLLATTLGMNCQTRAALRKPYSNSLVAKIDNNHRSHWNYNPAKVHLDSKQPVRAAGNLASSSGSEFPPPQQKKLQSR